jgi:hypothetical protein
MRAGSVSKGVNTARLNHAVEIRPSLCMYPRNDCAYTCCLLNHASILFPPSSPGDNLVYANHRKSNRPLGISTDIYSWRYSYTL